MSGEDKVGLGSHVVLAGVEPVAAEDGELAVVGELLQAILQANEVGRRGAQLSRQVVGVSRIGAKGVQRVHVVKAGQVVQPQNVAVQELRALNEVANDASVVGNGNTQSLLSRDGSGMHV